MPAAVKISIDRVYGILAAIFEPGPVSVSTSDSDPSEITQRFDSFEQLTAHFDSRIAAGCNFISYAVHYPDTGGYVEDRRVSLNPQKCKSHTFRYSVGGWGVIHVKLRKETPSSVACTISVNSQLRANAWFGTNPELKSPSLWNWPAVVKHERRLWRRVKSAPNKPLQRTRSKQRAFER